MSERSDYMPGEFCWVDAAVPSIEGGAEFYNELIGWEFAASEPVEETGGYGLFTQKGKQVAGMGPTQSEQQPPAWSSYVCVADADETAGKIKEAGGTVMMDPFDVFDAGRMAVCQDPQGAFFSLWQPGENKGAQLVNEVGAWTWNQLATSDLEGAKKFYGEVFGWSLEKSPEAPPDQPYFMWQVKGQKWEEGLGGAMEMGAGDFPEGVPPHWMVYFSVEDADAAVETTKGGGGQVMVPPLEIPVGRMSVMVDPQGAAFAVIQPDYPEPR